MTKQRTLVSRLRDPEYTGSNRCLPCTAVNLFIAVGVAVGFGTAIRPWTGVFTFVLFVGVIYLRGYLVPGTPTITARYFPTRLLVLFGKHPPVDRTLTETTGSADSVSEDSPSGEGDSLADASVVVYDGGDAELTPEFRDEWTERIATLGEDEVEAADVRRAFDADSVSQYGTHSFVLDGNRSLRWGSQAALVADVAAAELLRTRVADWSDFDGDRRRSLLRGLRLCLDRCPSCGDRLSATEDRIDPCCQKPHLVAESVCDGCGAAIADAAVVDRDDSPSVRMRLLRP